MSSVICSSLDQSKILLSGSGLKLLNKKMLDLSRLITYVDGNLYMLQMMDCVLNGVKNAVIR